MQNNPNTLLSEQHCFYPPACSSLLHYHYYLHSWASILSRSTAVSHNTSRRCERIVPSHCRSGCTCVAPPSFSSCSSSEGRGGDRASRRGRGQSHPAGAATYPHTPTHTGISVSPTEKKNKQLEAPNTRTGLRPTDQYKNII